MHGCLISIHAGHGAVDFADPPPGTVIVDFEGTLENAITITCNITHAGIQVGTSWSIENFFQKHPWSSKPYKSGLSGNSRAYN